ncbi:MAG TPA: hypothetical protein VF242_11000 [Nitrososphaeraceae archaeon]
MNNNLIYNKTLLIMVAIATAMFFGCNNVFNVNFHYCSIFTQSE